MTTRTLRDLSIHKSTITARKIAVKLVESTPSTKTISLVAALVNKILAQDLHLRKLIKRNSK